MSSAIDIRKDGESLDLPPDVQITLDLISPLFQDEIGGSSQSFSFTLPWTLRNQRLLNRTEMVLRSSKPWPEYEVRVYLFGLPWLEGRLLVKSASRESYEVALQVAESRLVRRMEETDLSNLSLGGTRIISTNSPPTSSQDMLDHANDTVANPQNHDYIFFPVKNPGHYGGARPAIEIPAQSIDEDHNTYVNYYRNGSFRNEVIELTQGTSGVCSLVPMPYLIYVIREALSEIGYDLLDTGWLTDIEIEKLVIFNLHTLDEGLDQEVAPNQWYNTNVFAKTISVPQHLPELTLREFVGAIVRMFSLVMVATREGVKLETRNDILDGTGQVDWSNKNEAIRLDFGDEPAFEFSSQQDGAENLKFEESELVPGIEPGNSVSSRANLPGVPAFGQLYYVQDENAFYRYQVIPESNPVSYEWKFEYFRTEKLVVGTNPTRQRIETKGSTTFIWQGPWEEELTDPDWRLPYVEQLCQTPMYQVGENNSFDLRLLFYRGELGYNGGNTYPLAEPDDTNGNYSLYWHGPNGLYKVWWERWIQYLQNSYPLSCKVNLSVTDILGLDWTLRHRIRVPEGYARGFLRRLQIQIGPNGITEATAQFQAQ